MHETRKIPTLVGILLVIALTAGIGFLFQFFAKTQTRASTSIEPQEVTVSNITDSSFTLTWQTEEPTSGTLLAVSATGKKYSGFDERDATGKLGKYTTHSVTIRSATPTTTYDVTIISNGKKYPIDKKSYQVTTFDTITTTPPNFDPAYGKVVMNDATPAEGTIVFLTLTDSQTLSTVVRNSGSWIIPLSTIRSFDGSSYLPESERITETLVVKKGTTESKVITDTLNDAPVPDITLGETYDFRNRDAKKPTTSTLAQGTQKNTNVLGSTTKASGTITLITPAEGSAVSTFRPQVTGTGVAGKKVTISLGIKNIITGTTIVGKDGFWRYTPSQSLPAGKQRITISTVDATNKPTVLTHTFTVLKSGTQVLGDATESAELTTPTPTIEEATESATLASEPMPTSGSLLPTIILLIVGTTLFVGGGSFLFIK